MLLLPVAAIFLGASSALAAPAPGVVEDRQLLGGLSPILGGLPVISSTQTTGGRGGDVLGLSVGLGATVSLNLLNPTSAIKEASSVIAVATKEVSSILNHATPVKSTVSVKATVVVVKPTPTSKSSSVLKTTSSAKSTSLKTTSLAKASSTTESIPVKASASASASASVSASGLNAFILSLNGVLSTSEIAAIEASFKGLPSTISSRDYTLLSKTLAVLQQLGAAEKAAAAITSTDTSSTSAAAVVTLQTVISQLMKNILTSVGLPTLVSEC